MLSDIVACNELPHPDLPTIFGYLATFIVGTF